MWRGMPLIFCAFCAAATLGADARRPRFIVSFPEQQAAAATARGGKLSAVEVAHRQARVRASAAAATGALGERAVNVTATFSHVLLGMVTELTLEAATYFRTHGATVEPDTIRRTSAIPWGLDRIDQASLPLNNVYNPAGDQGASAHIFVIDTGINSAHTDFTGRIAEGYNFVDDNSNPEDCHGHGTHTSGIAAGTTYGVAKRATLHPLRVLNCAGEGYASDTIAALDWVVMHDASIKIASMSLGGSYYATENLAVRAAVAAGVTVVVAAGNNAETACNYSPASASEAITVGATTQTDVASSFTNYGSCVDIFAPGSSILSAFTGSSSASATLSGTSMACPHVSGAAALIGSALGAGMATPARILAELAAVQVSGAIGASAAGNNSPNRLLQVLTGSPPPSPPSPPPYTSPPRPPPSPPPRRLPRSPHSPPPASSPTAALRAQAGDSRLEYACELTLSGEPASWAHGSAGGGALVAAFAAGLELPAASVQIVGLAAGSTRATVRATEAVGSSAAGPPLAGKLADARVLRAIEERIASATGASVVRGIVLTTVTAVGPDGVSYVVFSHPRALPLWLIVALALAGCALCVGGGTVASVLYRRKCGRERPIALTVVSPRASAPAAHADDPKAAASGALGERAPAANAAAQVAPMQPARAPSMQRDGSWLQGARQRAPSVPVLPDLVSTPPTTTGATASHAPAQPRESVSRSRRAVVQPPTGRPLADVGASRTAASFTSGR